MGCAQTSFLGGRKGVYGGRGEGEGTRETIAGGGGGWQPFLFMFRKIENDGMRPNPFSRWEKVRGIGK